ncbi:MAG: hypothetical protein ACR2QC_00905 [Gammaproteobacteria bacterium]
MSTKKKSTAIPAKAGISLYAFYNLRLRRVDSCLRRNGTGGKN